MNATETEIKLRVQCAWCGREIKRGRPRPLEPGLGGSAVSHGICKNCYAEELSALRKVFHSHRRPSA